MVSDLIEVIQEEYLIWLPGEVFWLWKYDDIFMYHLDECGERFGVDIYSCYVYTSLYFPFKVGYRTLELL